MLDQFVAGILRSPHGLTGEVKVESTSGEVEHLLRLKQAAVRHRGARSDAAVSYAVEWAAAHSRGLYMKFVGIDTPEEALKLSGGEILVERKDAAPLRAGQVYVEDLKGVGLYYGDTKAATVKDVLDIGAGFLLETVVESDGRIAMVPYKDPFIGKVDVKKGVLELKVLWILD